MSKASRMASGTLKPTGQINDAIEDVKAHAKRNADGIEAALAAGEIPEELARDWLENSTYAYRYEQLDDGSVLEIRVDRHGAKPKLIDVSPNSA